MNLGFEVILGQKKISEVCLDKEKANLLFDLNNFFFEFVTGQLQEENFEAKDVSDHVRDCHIICAPVLPEPEGNFV